MTPEDEKRLDEIRKHDDGYTIEVAKQTPTWHRIANNDRRFLLRLLDEALGNARRYEHCQMHGFPVRNQTGDKDRRWVAFRNEQSFFGATPSLAIEAARSAP